VIAEYAFVKKEHFYHEKVRIITVLGVSEVLR